MHRSIRSIRDWNGCMRKLRRITRSARIFRREEFFRVTVHTMMTACAYYAGGFIWGAENNKDYTPELLRIKEMILNYAKTLE